MTRSVTVAAGRYHTPAVLPGYHPGLGAPGAAIRTTRRIERRIARRTAAGFVHYVGEPLVGVPDAGCAMVMWEGMAVYDYGGVLYQSENVQYYPIEGAYVTLELGICGASRHIRREARHLRLSAWVNASWE